MFYLEVNKGVYKVDSFKITSKEYCGKKFYRVIAICSTGESLFLISDEDFCRVEVIYNKLKECIGKKGIISFEDLIY